MIYFRCRRLTFFPGDYHDPWVGDINEPTIYKFPGPFWDNVKFGMTKTWRWIITYHTMPPVPSWFLKTHKKPINYSRKYHDPKLLEWCSPTSPTPTGASLADPRCVPCDCGDEHLPTRTGTQVGRSSVLSWTRVGRWALYRTIVDDSFQWFFFVNIQTYPDTLPCCLHQNHL